MSLEWRELAAAPETHPRVLELLHKHLQPFQGAKVLDMPCGSGLFSKWMQEQGLKVTPMDIEDVRPFHHDPAQRVLGDANRGLPFPDGQFDAVVTVEGIEHLENPSFFLRECARVVRPGGHVVLTTPNVDAIKSRRHVYLKGYFRYFEPKGAGLKDAHHLHPIDMIFMRGAIQRAGLAIVEITVNQFSGKTWFTELTRRYFTHKLPAEMKGEVPYYGDVVIYVLTKP
ncbi:MAG: class I SAM-dependent methyltransferase [Pseudomonadota bacterium]